METLAASPPYLPFPTFLNSLLRLDPETSRVDWLELSARKPALARLLRGAWRFLGLVDEGDRPTPDYWALVVGGRVKPGMLGSFLGRAYPDVGSAGSLDPLKNLLLEAGLSGHTLTKAISFYMHAADYAGFDIRSSGHKIRARRSRSLPSIPLSQAAPPGEEAGRRVVRLRSGGELEVCLRGVSVLEWSEEDRKLVQAVKDLLDTYAEVRI